MLEWLVTFWSENRDTIITGLVLIVPTVFISRWSAMVPVRRKRRIRNREQRLRAQLEIHLENMEDTAWGLARAMFLLLGRLSTYFVLVFIQVVSALIGAGLAGRTVDTSIKLGNLVILIPAAFWIWRASKHVNRLLDPEPYKEKLEKQIKKTEDEKLNF